MIATPTWGSSSSILEYHKESQDNYYQKEGDLGQWQGKGAEMLGLKGSITAETLQNALIGKDANGNKVQKISIDKKTGERKRAGLDLTFNAPKSVSIMYEMAKANGNEELAEKILNIHNKAVENGLNHIEKNYAQSRETKDGITEHINTGNLAIAKFQHDIARPTTDATGKVSVDPSLHTHAVIINITKSKDREFKAIESKKIFENYMSAGMSYRAEMASEFKKAGFEINVTDVNKGFYEISLTGNSEKDELLLKEFSIRSEQIENAMSDLREKYPGKSETELKQMAAHKTREWKGEINRDQVRSDNFSRAAEYGLNAEKINSLESKINEKTEDNLKKTDFEKQAEKNKELAQAKEAIRSSIASITDEKSVFKSEDILQQAQKFLLSKAISPEQVKEAFNEQMKVKSDDRLLKVNDNTYTTRGILKAEKAILDVAKESKNRVQNIYTQKDSKEALKAYSEKAKEKTGYELTKGQKEAAHLILSSKDLVIGIQGDAGTGKTTMLKAVNELKGDAKLIGLSYTGKAAAEIEKATAEKQKEKSSQATFQAGGIKSSTLASFLNKVKSKDFDKNEIRNAKIIVDEASMLGIKDAKELLEVADKSNAQIVLMGDVKQFKAINAGDPFQLLQDNGIKTANMSEVLRQKDKTLIKAVAELNNYNSEKAFDTLDKRGMIEELKGDESIIDRIKDDYFKVGKAKDTLAVASVKDTLKNNIVLTQTNETKDALNHSIREEMKDRGLISKDEVNLKIRESSRLTPSKKYFADNYKEATNIFIQENIGQLKKGSEYKIIDRNTKKNHLIVQDSQGNNHNINLKKHSRSIQPYTEKNKDFSNGEKIVFEKNDKKLGVSNGTTGEIKSIDEKGNMIIKTDDNKTIFFNSQNYNYFNHGYAVTSYKAQGQTAKNVIAHMPGKSQNFNSFYVTVTRAEDNLKIYTDSKEDLKSTIHNEQIKDNALSLNDRLEKKEALEKEQMLLKHEQRKEARQEAFNNAPVSAKQLKFAHSIAKELNLEADKIELDTRAKTDTFIKDNLEIYQKAIENQPPSDKQIKFANNIAKTTYQEFNADKANVKDTKSFISKNASMFKEAIEDKSKFLLKVDANKLDPQNKEQYMSDLFKSQVISAYQKNTDRLDKLSEKYESILPIEYFEEKQIKIELYAKSLDIKSEDVLAKIHEKFFADARPEDIKMFGYDKPLELSKFLKENGIDYKDEKNLATAALVQEKYQMALFDKTDENTTKEEYKELEEKSEKIAEFTSSYEKNLVQNIEHKEAIKELDEFAKDDDAFRLAEAIEKNKDFLSEEELQNFEDKFAEIAEERLEEIIPEIEKSVEKEEEVNLELDEEPVKSKDDYEDEYER